MHHMQLSLLYTCKNVKPSQWYSQCTLQALTLHIASIGYQDLLWRSHRAQAEPAAMAESRGHVESLQIQTRPVCGAASEETVTY